MKRFYSLILTLALGLAAFAAMGSPAAASPITYYYTGQAFTSFTNGASCANFGNCHFSGSMTLAGPLGANAFSDPTTPTLFSFTDGATTFDNTNSHLINSLFTTNGNGDITNWVMSGAMNNNQFTWDQSDNWPQPGAQGDTLQLYGVGTASNSTPGVWSSTPPVVTPEPATWALFGTGALLLLGLGWQRRRAVSI